MCATRNEDNPNRKKMLSFFSNISKTSPSQEKNKAGRTQMRGLLIPILVNNSAASAGKSKGFEKKRISSKPLAVAIMSTSNKTRNRNRNNFFRLPLVLDVVFIFFRALVKIKNIPRLHQLISTATLLP